MRQFVPMSDDLLDRPEALPGPLVPYQCGLPCWHQLRADGDDAEGAGESGSATTGRRAPEPVSA